MTEQEKREYAIDIYNAGIALDATDFAFGVDGDSHFDRLAEHLAQLGYRKEEEVRNEIVSKLIDMILNTKCHNCDNKYSLYPDSCCSVGCDDLMEMLLTAIKKEFGLEVEE